MRIPDDLYPHMNDTKWDELRLAMYELGDDSPKWRTRDIETKYLSSWDGEWFYHFREGPYNMIEYAEIKVANTRMRDKVRAALVKINLPGLETDDGFIVTGYSRDDHAVEYIKSL